MSFVYNVDEMPRKLNSYSYQLAYDEIGFIIHQFTQSPQTLQWH